VHLITLGLNHNSAPIELRESVAITDVQLPAALGRLAKIDYVREAAIISTCNRTELYVVTQSAYHFDHSLLIQFLSSVRNVPEADLARHLYQFRDIDAVTHLMKVAAGLDSMMLGEYQIMAQIKSAYAAAQAANSVDSWLNSLFQTALNIGKRVRTDTEISRGVFSIGAAAVEFAIRIFGDSLSHQSVLLIGAGETSELTARHLQARGASTVFVANRTRERAETLAAQLDNAYAVDYSMVDTYLTKADIVICSTSSDIPVITKEMVKNALRLRRNRPLYMVDIAMPRDIETAVGFLDNVFLYNIDDLANVVDHAKSERMAEILKAEQIVADAANEYMLWRQSLDATPLIISVRERLESLRLDEMSKLRARLPHLDEREVRAVEQSLQSLCNKIAHDAITSIKLSYKQRDENGYIRLEAVKAAFGLNEKSEK
jgi:glutamyl-tRNA reductase